MHKSRFVGLSIDCDTDDLDDAARFWSHALGASAKHAANLAESPYVGLDMPADEPYIEIQKVDHPSRVHIDIESDNVAAEVERLEKHGATRVAEIKSWIVMEAPTGQRFCVVPAQSADFDKKAHTWA